MKSVENCACSDTTHGRRGGGAAIAPHLAASPRHPSVVTECSSRQLHAWAISPRCNKELHQTLKTARHPKERQCKLARIKLPERKMRGVVSSCSRTGCRAIVVCWDGANDRGDNAGQVSFPLCLWILRKIPIDHSHRWSVTQSWTEWKTIR